jgi:Putative Actinobacterial Holin-X, holin superfamily III
MKGILQDAQDLVGQQLQLFRSEVKQEVRQLKSGILSISIGAVIAAVGALTLVGMLVHLLAAKTEIPLWGCYGIVGGGLTVGGLVILLGGKKSVADVHLAPPPETAQALKENVAWLKNLKHGKTAEPTA